SGEGQCSGPEEFNTSNEEREIAFTEDRIDITEEFFTAAAELPMGEMVCTERFTLAEAMSAIELMDPKMDGGCIKLREHPTVEDVVAEGWLRGMADDEVLATVDATLACLSSWLEGAFIAQTMHTNLLMTDPDVLSAACECQPEKEEKDRVPGRTLTALSHGLAHLVLIIRHTIGTASVCEEEDFAMQFPVRVQSSLSFDETLELIKDTEKTLQAVAKANKTRAPMLAAVLDRLVWVRTTLLAMQHMVIPRNGMYSQETQEPVCFRPRLKQAMEQLTISVDCASRFYETVEMGKMAPAGQDGDYGWLTCFIPDLNRRFLPPAFPRKSEFLTRRHGLHQLEKMSRRLYDISSTVPHVVNDVASIMQYLRTFCELESCALTRSTLQLVLLPNDERILGETLMGDILKESIKNHTGLPLLYQGSPSNKSEAVQEMFDDFIQDTVRVYLIVMQAFGHNTARQRDKIGVAFEDFAQLLMEADRVDQEATQVTEDFAQANNGDIKGPSPGSHIAAFMNVHTVRLVHWHFELGFRLEVYAEYEYAMVWWYMREVVCKWIFSWLDTARKYLYSEYQSELSKVQKEKAVKTKTNKMNKVEEKFKKRLATLKHIYTQGEEVMYAGMHKLCVGLQASGRIRVPELMAGQSERLRYEHRLSPLKPFGHPFHVSYDNYKNSSQIESMLASGATKCFKDAAACFTTGREALSLQKEDPRALALARVCGQNAVVCKILASGLRPDARVEFDFSDKSSPFSPTLKLV
ncbi:hypothetical protein PENTCL1PPCAC_1927, partial [Pristionchus entomophagus]